MFNKAGVQPRKEEIIDHMKKSRVTVKDSGIYRMGKDIEGAHEKKLFSGLYKPV